MSQLTRVCLAFSLLLPLLSHADIKSMMHERAESQQVERTQTLATSIESLEFRQFINHADPAHGTFKQRYYVDESLSKDNDAPVFFYICGESVCRPSALMGAIREHAKRFGAKLVALEHRFYGKSLPFNSLSTDSLAFLSTDYALKDLANFQKIITRKRGWKGKWVAFGGSYPGSLSAYYRNHYPNLVVGSLASSAPVEAREDFQEYDAHVTKVAGSHCAKLMNDAVQRVECDLSDPTRLNYDKSLFEAAHIRDNVDFLYLIADVGAAAVQYGVRDQFCDALNNAPDPLEGYAEFAKRLYKMWGVKPEQFVAQGAMSEDPADYPEGLGMRQWFYQSCREYGYWQNAHHDPLLSTRSHLIDLEYHHTLCKRLFDIDTPARTDQMNERFYKPLRDPKHSNTFFTNGSTDPWMTLSLAVANGNTNNPNHDYYTIEGAAHCDDLRPPKETDSDALRHAREHTDELIRAWLK